MLGAPLFSKSNWLWLSVSIGTVQPLLEGRISEALVKA